MTAAASPSGVEPLRGRSAGVGPCPVSPLPRAGPGLPTWRSPGLLRRDAPDPAAKTWSPSTAWRSATTRPAQAAASNGGQAALVSGPSPSVAARKYSSVPRCVPQTTAPLDGAPTRASSATTHVTCAATETSSGGAASDHDGQMQTTPGAPAAAGFCASRLCDAACRSTGAVAAIARGTENMPRCSRAAPAGGGAGPTGGSDLRRCLPAPRAPNVEPAATTQPVSPKTATARQRTCGRTTSRTRSTILPRSASAPIAHS
mmetsp:Transcript_566/g.2012  ORF Transcript_566/g.2012 Transcript_566/m.2012 type:complete len:259 (-) Transcript_566:611-1387(-)